MSGPFPGQNACADVHRTQYIVVLRSRDFRLFRLAAEVALLLFVHHENWLKVISKQGRDECSMGPIVLMD